VRELGGRRPRLGPEALTKAGQRRLDRRPIDDRVQPATEARAQPASQHQRLECGKRRLPGGEVAQAAGAGDELRLGRDHRVRRVRPDEVPQDRGAASTGAADEDRVHRARRRPGRAAKAPPGNPVSNTPPNRAQDALREGAALHSR
jgi:hypothetical protein